MKTNSNFFGDGEYALALTMVEVEELERATDTGIPTLIARLMTDSYRVTELRHIIRLSLIGGGMTPERAHQLIESYFIPTGLPKCRLLALIALSTLMGTDDEAAA